MTKLQLNSFWLVKSGILFYLLASLPVTAQIVPDATLPVNSNVQTQDNISNITGGTAAGGNLFHSFEQFSVPTGGEAYFNNTLDIQNILNRVTGGYVSEINGLIRTNGKANLFLLNPNGIIFGSNAQLNVGGSFLASTANSLSFTDGTSFSATSPQTTPLLTVSVPIGLQYGETAGGIQVQGNSQGTRATAELINTTTGLRVEPNKTLALVGGNVALEGGTLTAEQGRIELGSVASPALVSLTPIDSGWALGYEGITTFGDIQLFQQATADASGAGGGDVQVQGRRVTLIDGSQIEASTLGAESGGTLTVRASESVELSGTSSDSRFPSGLYTGGYRGTTGAGASLTVETGRLSLRNGAQIGSDTFGAGSAGTLTINANELVELIGTSADGRLPSGLSTSSYAGGTGAVGNLILETGRLSVRDGAQILANTSGAGSAGTLAVNAKESVELSGTSTNGRFSSGLFFRVQRGATGGGGNLILETKRLSIRDGAQISASTSGTGSAATLAVNAKESVELSGTAYDRSSSFLAARTVGAGNGGDLRIKTEQLIVQDGAEISVGSTGSGNAGQLEVKAGSIYLDNQGKLLSATLSGEGGNITLQVQDSLQMRRNSQISAEAGGTGNGGNITIGAGTLATLENSNITANAFEGQGGNVQINTQGLFRSLDSNITATSQLGINGVVEISTADIDLQNSLTELATNFVSADQVIAGSCLARRNQEQGTFVITGNGGLPINPYSGIEEWDNLTGPQPNEGDSVVRSQQQQQPVRPQKTAHIQTEWKLGDPIVEAQGIVKTADGRTLVTTLPQKAALQSADKLVCPSN